MNNNAKNFKSVLLLKVPFCPYPDTPKEKEDFRAKSTFRPWPSLALAALCAFVDRYKTLDYKIKAIDVNIEGYSEPNVSIDTSLYPELLAESIKNNDYDVLAISATFIFDIKWVDMAVKLSRKYHPDAKIIVGGGYPTIFPERCLKGHAVDSVVIGEGEAAFMHILNRYNGHKDEDFEKRFPFEGYGYRHEDGRIEISPKGSNFLDLNDLPMPSWEYLNIDKYLKNSGDRILPIEGSRGCPYACTYCCSYMSWGRKVRYKSVDNLIKEMLDAKKRFSIKSAHFIDDNLSFSKERFSSFLKKFIETRLNLKINISNFSVKHIDEELIDLMAEAGMDSVTIAVESGSQEIRRRINKAVDLDYLRKMVKKIKSKGMKLQLTWMVGFPGETLEQINSTFDLARELNGHSLFSVVRVYPATKLFEEAHKAGYLTFDEDRLGEFDYQRCNLSKSGEWDYKTLRKMVYDVNIEINFLNSYLFNYPKGSEKMREFLEDLILKLPEHVMAHIILGYINKDAAAGENSYYKAACDLLKDRSLYETFGEYLLWGHPIVSDFNKYCKAMGVEAQE
ncbi:MAG: radical SAM protein [Candidatus Omnitrophota bacterium]